MARRKKTTGPRWPYWRAGDGDSSIKFIGQHGRYDLWTRKIWNGRHRLECVRTDGYPTDYSVDIKVRPGQFYCPYKQVKAALVHGLMLLRDPSISPNSR